MAGDFLDYELPQHLIAQEPAADRDGSRLLVVDRSTVSLRHHYFRDLPELLAPGDLIVLNDTRVLPARVIGHREKTGGKWEGLFLRETPDGLWEMLTQTRGHPAIGETIVIEPGPLKLTLRGRTNGHWLVEPSPAGRPAELLAISGQVPLPPYIRKGRAATADRERYQTVYARADGSVAAPTAGLHFTPAVFERLRARGIAWTHVTLHVGLGTFEPIKTDDPTQHQMHSEWGEVPAATVEAIRACKARGGRVIAIGTTAARALESAARGGALEPWTGDTDIFIHPPYRYRVVDGLVTNFHLPRTTLLLLVAALAGPELVKAAYAEAVAQEYRFFSYGDAMLILPPT
ncbi:MAG TPA: tRNA preQ1(34) S-adenosylmethionine ribosyltransferase-isomerase QueA [Gemmataceae bacterium]|jgi:S-adenosylmethionine:tRNA ribosyltransferase-isomerase|nr:tRNA preQ1(34) S-adenosylmethionine ribosyltransferase-isomerase QueA [Gemmataceae bacterium]